MPASSKTNAGCKHSRSRSDKKAKAMDTVLNKNGDLILQIRDDHESSRQYIVYSKILKKSSKYFATLLGSRFAEGKQIKKARTRGERPMITLQEDDMESMNTILHVLCGKSAPKSMDIGDLVDIAVLSDKYQLSNALRSYIEMWMRAATKPAKTDFKLNMIKGDRGYGYVVLAAYLFQNTISPLPDLDRVIDTWAPIKLRPCFDKVWGSDEVLRRIPESVIDKIKNTMAKRRDAIHICLQIAETRLKGQMESFDAAGVSCKRCGDIHAQQTKRCRSCGSRKLIKRSCAPENRLQNLRKLLDSRQLMLSTSDGRSSDDKRPLSQIQAAFIEMAKSNKHTCQGGDGCLLDASVKFLSLVVRGVCANSAEVLYTLEEEEYGDVQEDEQCV